MDQKKSKRHKIQTNFIIGTNSCNLKKNGSKHSVVLTGDGILKRYTM